MMPRCNHLMVNQGRDGKYPIDNNGDVSGQEAVALVLQPVVGETNWLLDELETEKHQWQNHGLPIEVFV